MKCTRDTANYRMVQIQSAGSGIRIVVGVLVQAAFGSFRPSPEHELDHGDQNKHNDSIWNTTWVTRSENNSKEYKDPVILILV